MLVTLYTEEADPLSYRNPNIPPSSSFYPLLFSFTHTQSYNNNLGFSLGQLSFVHMSYVQKFGASQRKEEAKQFIFVNLSLLNGIVSSSTVSRCDYK
jgi:hypothetical protein